MQNLDDDEDGCEVKDGESVSCPIFLMDSLQRVVAGVDLADHQPGFRSGSDAERAAVRDARQGMIDRAANAWKGNARRLPPQFTCPECHGTGKDPDGDSPDDKCDMCGGTGSIRGPNRLSSFQRRDPGPYPDASLRLDARDARRAAYETYCANLRDAWKRPMDAAEPSNSSSPAELRAHRHDIEPDHDAEAMLRGHLQRGESQRRRDDAWARYRDNLQNAWQRGRTDPHRATEIMRQAASENWKHGAA
jgi:hypothetical protein